MAAEDLADQGLQQLRRMLEITRSSIQLYENCWKPSGKLALDHEQRPPRELHALREEYAQLSQSLRSTVEKLAQAPVDRSQPDPNTETPELAEKLKALRQEAQDKNDEVKYYMDGLRDMLQAMTMWEAYSKQTEAGAKPAAK